MNMHLVLVFVLMIDTLMILTLTSITAHGVALTLKEEVSPKLKIVSDFTGKIFWTVGGLLAATITTAIICSFTSTFIDLI